MPSGSDRPQPGQPRPPLPAAALPAQTAALRRPARRGIGAARARSRAEPPSPPLAPTPGRAQHGAGAALGGKQAAPGAPGIGAGRCRSAVAAAHRLPPAGAAVRCGSRGRLTRRGAPAEFRRRGRRRPGQLPPLLPALSPHWPRCRGQVARGRARAPPPRAARRARRRQRKEGGEGAESTSRAAGTCLAVCCSAARRHLVPHSARPCALVGGSGGSSHGRALWGSRVHRGAGLAQVPGLGGSRAPPAAAAGRG